MSIHGHSTDGFEPDLIPTEEPDEEHLAELEAEFDRRQEDDYEVTHQWYSRTLVLVGTRDNLTVACLAAKNPARNER